MKGTLTAVVLIFLTVFAWMLFDGDTQPALSTIPQSSEQPIETIPSTTKDAQSPVAALSGANAQPASMYAQALKLLERAKNGDAQAQFDLSKILHLCGILTFEDNGASFNDDANYFLATVKDKDAAVFKSLKQTLDSCSDFTSQNLNDFQYERQDVQAADYWLIQATMQRHPEAVQQALFYFPRLLQQDKESLALLEQQLANEQPNALFNLGTCLVQKGHEQGAALMMQGCKSGKDCSASTIDPMRLVVLFGCTALSRKDEIAADGSVFNPQLACYQQSSFLDASRTMFGDKTDAAIADELAQLKRQLNSAKGRQALLQTCVSQ